MYLDCLDSLTGHSLLLVPVTSLSAFLITTMSKKRDYQKSNRWGEPGEDHENTFRQVCIECGEEYEVPLTKDGAPQTRAWKKHKRTCRGPRAGEGRSNIGQDDMPLFFSPGNLRRGAEASTSQSSSRRLQLRDG